VNCEIGDVKTDKDEKGDGERCQRTQIALEDGFADGQSAVVILEDEWKLRGCEESTDTDECQGKKESGT
jgi:hypothetical protein